jgi:hypothetical protein
MTHVVGHIRGYFPYFPPRFSRPHLIFEETFEPGPKSLKQRRFRFSGNNTVDIISNDKIVTSAAYFSLNRLENENSYRTEMVPLRMARLYIKKGRYPKYGQAYWYGLRMFIPEDWQWDEYEDIMMQWHGLPDFDLDETHRNPPLSLRIERGSNGPGQNYYVQIYADSKRVTPQKGAENRYTVHERHEIGPVTGDVGRWTDWVFKINWSYENEGYFTIWKNGHVVFEYSGPTAFNDYRGPYLKFGLYKPDWKKTKSYKGLLVERHVYFDDIRIGTHRATYRDVAPNPNLGQQ